jgi:hypothetical protein
METPCPMVRIVIPAIPGAIIPACAINDGGSIDIACHISRIVTDIDN